MAWLSLRLTEEEKEKIREKAEQASLSISDYARAVLLSTKNIRRKQKMDCEAIKRLVYEINKIGVNLNQIARKINTSRDIDIQVLESLRNMEYALVEILSSVRKEDDTD